MVQVNLFAIPRNRPKHYDGAYFMKVTKYGSIYFSAKLCRELGVCHVAFGKGTDGNLYMQSQSCPIEDKTIELTKQPKGGYLLSRTSLTRFLLNDKYETTFFLTYKSPGLYQMTEKKNK